MLELLLMRHEYRYGYQLHVLSFTVHSILVSTSTKFNLGDLDYCVNDIVNIIVDDIFGATGQEKDAEDYISKMKEVKSSKSYDSMELVARITTLGHLMDLIRPIQNLLYERLNDRMVKKIDELLRRLRQGLAKNEAATDQNILKFCHEIWSEASSTSPADKPAKFADQRTKRYLVNMKAAHKASYRGTTTAQTSRLVRFAIDVLRDMIPKNENFQTPANLTGFVELIGKAIAADDEDIKTAAMRLVTSIIRVVRHPFQKLDEGAAAYAREAMRVVRNAQSTNTESAQAALRMATEILQKRHDAAIRDHDIAFLLKALKNDLQDAQRQNTAFGFVRAVINRRVVIPEVHETMTQMREIMIQSHSRESRKLARDVYFAFLMSPEYFQGKGREKQIAFLVKNLAFEHAEGRQSVMEILHLLLTKENEKNIDGIHDMVFVPLVMSMANDDSEQCRTLAEILIKAVFERAIESRMKAFLKMIRDWTRKEDLAPQQTGFRCWTAYVEVKQQSAEKNSDFVKSAQQLLEAKVSEAKARQPDVESGELLYFALKALETYVKLNNKATTNAAFTPNKEQLWSLICECQFFPHVWVKLIAAQLVSLYLSDFAAHNAKASFGTAPLPGSGGLELQKDRMFQITRACLRILSIEEAEIEPKEELLAQAIKSLAFMARCFASNRLLWTSDRYSDPGAGVDEDKENDIDIDDDDQGEDDGEDLHHKPALQFLIGRLAAVLRRTPRRSHSTGMRAHKGAMQLLSNLCSNIEVEYLEGCLPMILRSLHNLIDPSITHVSDHHGGALILSFSALQDSARELLRLLQNKLGTDTYLAAMSKVKAVAKEKREDRRAKRRIEAVSMPEKVATVKRKKREHAREKRKEKNQAMRGMRRGW